MNPKPQKAEFREMRRSQGSAVGSGVINGRNRPVLTIYNYKINKIKMKFF
jgi:hypothetical protein